jgi:pSer/pThr/pTyr-binding forkhead associated (FHA) protein
MGFQLKIAEGKDAGKEFEFDQDSVMIGRTPECDVVLYDAGVSRKHCRIFNEGSDFLIEDMGSSNGTKVNGAPISRKQALATGDKLTLGPVVFVFEAVEEQASDPSTDAGFPLPEPGGDANSTRIVSVDKVKPRAKNKGEALKPEGMEADPENLDKIQRSATRALPAVRPNRPPTGNLPRTSGASAAVPRASGPSGAIERAAPSSPAPRRMSGNSGAVERAAPAKAGGLSAAERARIKRESPGGIAQLKLFWLQASAGVRSAIMAGFGVLALGVVAGAYYYVISQDIGLGPRRGPEPMELSNKAIPDSFGLGEGVTWPKADLKNFTWEYTAATRAVVILHFQAQGISQGEVVVTVNGVDVGQVPADTLASRDRSLEIMIPPNLLKKGEVNRIVFDNTKNPPGEDEWRIWNVRVEKALLPDLPTDELVAKAREAYSRGRLNFERINVGARNRYEAWKSFRESWLLLEAHPEPKPDLYFEARDRMKEAQQELDKTCAKLLLETEGYYNQRNFRYARDTLDHIREYFPEYDQPCATHAENKRAEYGF